MALFKVSGSVSVVGSVTVKPVAPVIQPTLITAITTAGLTSGIQYALDAGDSNSYSGTGQSWLDTSGNEQDFFRGADGSASTDDPTFNGTAGGLSDTEYWSFDGGDFFRYDSAQETWMDNLHKNNARFAFMAWVFVKHSGVENQYITATAHVGANGLIGSRLA